MKPTNHLTRSHYLASGLLAFFGIALVLVSLAGCATGDYGAPGAPGPGQCKLMCQGEKVEFYRDELSECRCYKAHPRADLGPN